MIAALVLAAGASERYGSPKQLELADGETWVQRTVRIALEAGCGRVVVVTGANEQAVQAGFEQSEQVEAIAHADWDRGLGSSIAAGMRRLLADETADGALLLVCDQLQLDRALLLRLIGAFDGTPLRTVACAYAGTVGVPAIFERGWFERLSGLDGDSGAKSLLLESAERLIEIDWPQGAEDRDRKRAGSP